MTRTALLLALVLGGCGTQYADPIQGARGPAGDACAARLTREDCVADTTHGCSFQPNPVGCKTTDPSCAPGVCRSGYPFVRRQGEGLLLHDLPYRFVGTVSWGIAWGRSCTVTTMPDQQTALARAFDGLVDVKASVLKIWAFQSYAGASGTDYASFERVVDAARRAGVRLIFVLENQYTAGCTSGPPRDDAWYGGGYATPYGDHALSFPDYVRGVVAHFRDEPTILGWEIMHEAGTASFDALDGFAANLSSSIRASDPNHLVVLGVDNGTTGATSREGTPSNYERLHAHPAVDMLDSHDFFSPETPLVESLTQAQNVAFSLGKPAFVGASAVELTDTTPASFERRAGQVEAKLTAALDAGFVGFLVYDYIPDWVDVTWSFDARPQDPLAGPNGVLARHSSRSP